VLIERYDGDRAALLPLFALADDSPAQIASYIGSGEVLVARDGEAMLGHAQIIGTVGGFELKSIAVAESRQRAGIGRALVEAAIARCRAQGGAFLTVSTATADIGNLRFYQRLGFRMTRIVRDAFGLATGYPEGLTIDGIVLRDQVFLEFDLRA
jgi:ribosomal protein S18 acetylase RimI-like enzyme